MKSTVIAILTIWMAGNFFGFLLGSADCSFKQCKYSSVASRAFVGYYIGCELFKPRYK